MRIPDALWSAALQRSLAEGKSVTSIVTAALRQYVDSSPTRTSVG